MGTQHHPRRTEFDRAIAKQARTRDELMRRAAHRARENTLEDLLDKYHEGLANRAALPSTIARPEGFTHIDSRTRLDKLVDHIHAVIRDFWQAHR